MKNLLLFTLLICISYLPTLAQENLTFQHDGLERKYILYLPDGLEEGAPLLFVLHGYTDQAIWAMEYTEMNLLADEHKFAVCYPVGTKDQAGDRFWNVNYDFHDGKTVDDVGFLVDLAEHLQTSHALHPMNTFVTGFSNGADMCFMLACEVPETFKAVAPVGGTLMKDIHDDCANAAPIPVFITNGTADPISLWEGDIENWEGWGAFYNIPYGAIYFSQKNSCMEVVIDTFPDINLDDGSFVVSERYVDGINNHEVWLYAVQNGGHHWAGFDGNQDIHLSTEIWDFFTKYIADVTEVSEIPSPNMPQIHISPNPTSDKIVVQSNDLDLQSYVLTNSQNKVISKGQISTSNKTIDLSNSCAGIYFLSLNNHTYKIVKTD